MEKSKRSNRVVTKIAVLIVALCAIGLVGLLIWGTRAAREAARRANCMNHFMQISLALLAYESDHGSLPPMGNSTDTDQPAQSWRVAILPYLDRKNLYEQYDPSEPWNSEKNLSIADEMPLIYRCPNVDNDKSSQTSYVVLVGPKTIGGLAQKDRNIEYISSHAGTSVTLLIVEVPNSGIHWMEPRDLTIDEIIEWREKGQMSAHGDGFVVSFCDGHVKYIQKDIDSKTLRALADPNDKKLDESNF